MKTKRIIASALAFIMATTVAASSVYAAGEKVSISASKTEAVAGSSFSVDISLSDVPATGIMGCEFAITYDSSVLNITDVTAGAIANTGSDSAESDISGECPSFYTDISKAGTINLTWSTGLDDNGYWIKNDGVLATISGTVASGAAAGEYPIEIVAISRDDISGTNNSIYVGYIDANNSVVEYDTSVTNGAVNVVATTSATTTTTGQTTVTTEQSTTTTTVTTGKTEDTTTAITGVPGVNYGDINLDGSVSMIDVVYLNKYMAKIVTLNDQQLANADCVLDNEITGSDVGALLKYNVGSIKALPVNP